MTASQRLYSTILTLTLSSSSSTARPFTPLLSRTFFSFSLSRSASSLTFANPAMVNTRSAFLLNFFVSFTVTVSSNLVDHLIQRRGGRSEQQWKQKPKNVGSSSAKVGVSCEEVRHDLGKLHLSDNRGLAVDRNAESVDGHNGSVSFAGSNGQPSCDPVGSQSPTSPPVPPIQFGGTRLVEQPSLKSQMAVWKPKGYATSRGIETSEAEEAIAKEAADTRINNKNETSSESNSGLSGIFVSKTAKIKLPLGVDFNVDNATYSEAQIRATFYPKFENEKSDQEIRTRMIEMVSKGQATLEVSLKHSGSLFMYAGHEGGAYAKNSYGNIYTAVGVFVLGRMFVEAWGAQANKKQKEFREFLEKNRMCISMELVTAVLGDHGQRPLEDYVVVTAVTDLGKGKPNFYSTPDLISFCRKWRLPTNHVWLFSTRKSVTSFFAAYDALCEEGTATPVCRALDEVADVSVPGSKDHVKVQGEILEGLVARIVSHKSTEHMKKVLCDYPPPPLDGAAVGLEAGLNLREICAANRTSEQQQIKALLQSVGIAMCPDYLDWFGVEDLDSHSRNADRSVLSKFLQAHPTDYPTLKLQEMIRLMKIKRFPSAFKCYCNFHKLSSISKDNIYLKMVIHVQSDSAFRRYQREMRENPGLWPLYRGFFLDINLFKVNKETAAEMSKDTYSSMKNMNGGSDSNELDGLADEDANLMIKLKFLTYKLRTFLIRNGLSTLFKEGPTAYKAYYLRAVHIRRKMGRKQLPSSVYLSEAEPFLEAYAKRSPENQALIGSAGSLVRSEDFLAIVEGGHDEEGMVVPEIEAASLSPSATVKDVIPKDEGLIIFFPGIPGCAKSALCKEILSAPGGLGDERPIHSLMGDLIKGRYWQKVADERRKKPLAITLADKNAPNEEVWRQIEGMCRSTRASAVPVVPDSEGTVSNPFSLEDLAVFIFRVLNRVNHPDRREFENDLAERFGTLVKMPLLQPDRAPLPDPVRNVLEEGLDLYKLHTSKHGRLDSTKGTYATDWARWEKKLRETLFANAEYLNAIQVPFDYAVKQVLEQLRAVVKGERTTPGTEKRKFGNIVFAAITLPVEEIKACLGELAKKHQKVEKFLQDKNLEKTLTKAHVTLAHKRGHGVTSVASYGIFLNQKVPVDFTALLVSQNLAALEAQIGSIDGEKVVSKNEWPHVTLWAGNGASAKDANMLPQLVLKGEAARVDFHKPVTVSGVVDFY
ncbi:hypothetical protein EJ110_NYTH09213 [Nymphaea thermarum]|nr:hypothetical protein EJ110_NYTH09213 [Nymphaea thermarum]